MMEIYDSWWEEKRSAFLYKIMAENETNVLHKKLFNDLKEAAENQATLWEKKIKDQGLAAPHSFQPDLRTRLIAWLVRYLGAESLHSMLSAMKIRGMSVFTRYHSEHKHTGLNSASNLRAAVFGINDGLISNMGLILGITGASTEQHFIILAGIAGLLAGACSMAAGEYISVRSQREVFEYQIELEKQELEEYPEEEAEELSLIYEARGVPREEAQQIAAIMIKNPETGLNTLAREELGLNPNDLVSPISAMLSSFISFALGAFIPLLPFLIDSTPWKLLVSLSITAIALFLTGALSSLFTHRHPMLLGFRMLAIGCVAGIITFLIGKSIGIAI